MPKFYVYKIEGKAAIADSFQKYMEQTAGESVILNTTVPYEEEGSLNYKESDFTYKEAYEMAEGIRQNYESAEIYTASEFINKVDSEERGLAFAAGRNRNDRISYGFIGFDTLVLQDFKGEKVSGDSADALEAECRAVIEAFRFFRKIKTKRNTLAFIHLEVFHYCYNMKKYQRNSAAAEMVAMYKELVLDGIKVDFVWNHTHAERTEVEDNFFAAGCDYAIRLARMASRYELLEMSDEEACKKVFRNFPDLMHLIPIQEPEDEETAGKDGLKSGESKELSPVKNSQQEAERKKAVELSPYISHIGEKPNSLALDIFLECVQVKTVKVTKDWAPYNVLTLYALLFYYANSPKSLIDTTLKKRYTDENLFENLKEYFCEMASDGVKIRSYLSSLVMDELMQQEFVRGFLGYPLAKLPDSPLKAKIDAKLDYVSSELLNRAELFFQGRLDSKDLNLLDSSQHLTDWIFEGGHDLMDLYMELTTNPKCYIEIHNRYTGYWKNPDVESRFLANEEEEKQNITLTKLVDKTEELRSYLSKKIIGQDAAIEKMVDAYFDGEKKAAENKDRKGARNVILFAGPPGVGKTFMAENFAKCIGLPYKRFDMSTYANDNDEVEIVGTSTLWRNSKKGVLTSFVRENPKCIVLLDEIEKAHIKVIYLFLQILDAGILFDRHEDCNVSFKDVTLIFTTNAGKELYEDAYGRDLTQLNNKIIMDALAKDVNPLTNAPYFPGAIASRMQSYNIVMFNHLSAGNIKRILERNIEEAIGRTEKAFGLTIGSSQFLAPSILFEMGGRSDARNASKMFEKFLDSQLLELLVLMKAKMGSSAVDKYTKIDWNFNWRDAGEDVKNCFEGDKYGTILVWGDDTIAFDERLEKRKIKVRQTASIEEFKETIQKESVLFTVIDYCKGITSEQRKRYLNIMDIDCDGRELIDYVNENVFDVPIYLIEPAEEGFIPEEKRAFGLNGIYDFLTWEEDKEGRADQIYEIYMNISLQNSIDTLVYKHQAVKFKTRQNIYPEERRAEIEFYDFKMTTLVESEDQEKFISAELKPNVHWEDIKVNDDVIEELQIFIGYLKNPKSYAVKGMHGINGVLLYGPPGTGKTSLAKVVATEADISFLAVSASELLVGGTQKVKETFRVARKYAPTVLFIDEIDAVGMDRKHSGSNSVLNTLLTEMDGFGKNNKKPVFVIAATNLNQYLDPALDRRFDRKILIEVPNEEGRIWLLRNFIRKNQENFEVSEEQLISIAKRAVGRSPSELKDVINTAVRESIRKNSKVTDEILDNAFEKTISGDIRKGVSYEDTLCTARHEIGHVITALANGEKPVYVSVIGRGGHNGYMQQEERVSTHRTKKDYLNMLCTILGGRAAEMEYYGEDGIGAGASGDIQKATAIAVSMVCELGMFQKEIGIAAISLEDYKNDTAAKALVNQVLNDQLHRARMIVRENKQVCDRLIESLMSSKGKYLTQKEILQVYENR